MNDGWNPARKEKLRQLWGQGQTCSQIAAELGGALTRNAVISMAHRLGLAGRPSPINRSGDGPSKPRQPRAARMDPRTKPPRKLAEPAPAAVRSPARQAPRQQLTSSRDRCAWPIGDPREAGFHFCGDTPVLLGKPYCQLHCNVAYRSPDEAARERAAEMKGKAA